MLCLIVTEFAIFSIFVVAYVFYIGKSLTGPTPSRVLDHPSGITTCLLSSSLTVGIARARLEEQPGKRVQAVDYRLRLSCWS